MPPRNRPFEPTSPNSGQPPVQPIEFWQHPGMRAALASRHIGRVIHAYRTHPWHTHDITQRQTAAWLHMNQGHLSRIENGRPVDELSKLTHWATVLKIPPELLWFELPAPKHPQPTTSGGNQRLQRLRHARNWTPNDAAARMRTHIHTTTGRNPAIDARTIERLETGEITHLPPDYSAALRAIYAVTTDEQLGLISAANSSPTLTSRPSTGDRAEPNELIRARRIARGWTQQQAADAITAAVAQATGKAQPSGIDAQWIGRLERGERRWPNANYRAALRTVYGATTDTELGLYGIRGRNTSMVHARTGSSDVAPAIIESTTIRRPEVTLLTAAKEAADFASWAEHVNTGDVTIASLNIRAKELAAASLTSPPAHVVSDATALNRETFTLLKGHQKPYHARELYAIAAQTCALMAWLSGDLGALEAATLQGSAAQVCADHADHAEVSAWVAVVRSKTAFWRGDYLTAARLAQQGASYSPPGTAAVMLACQEADAYAKLGAVDRVTDALKRADEAADGIRGTDTIGGLFSCEPARHANYASGSYLLTGRPGLALAEADRALTEFSGDSRYGFGTIGQVHITRTLAFVARGDIDGAAQAIRPVLDLPDDRRLATLKDRLRSAISLLGRQATRGSKVAAPLRAEITEFCGASSTQKQLTTGVPTEEGS